MASKNTEKTEELVKIKIPKTKSQQDDVFVSVNNRTWQIQRGVYVEVPACVAEVLRHAEDMEMEAARYEEQVRSK